MKTKKKARSSARMTRVGSGEGRGYLCGRFGDDKNKGVKRGSRAKAKEGEAKMAETDL